MERVNILGVGVSAINMPMALETIDIWIRTGKTHYICVSTVHGIMECQRDEKLRQIHNSAGMVTPDGMPLVWLNWLKGYRHVERVYGPDLMLEVCRESVSKGYKHYLYGGKAGVAELLSKKLTELFPGLLIAGAYSPPFRPLTIEEDQAVVDQINASGANIVWIGLGAPKQERWMAEHVDTLCFPVLIGVGAVFDYHSGVKRQAPRWMQRSGLEWLFRLLSEPVRLGPRYLINIPVFLFLILLQLSGIKKFKI